MELHHLRRFITLAEELHFARAAARLHIEPSPLSRTIKELETDLGATLFCRDRRGTRLTSAGRTLLQEARRVLTVATQARENVRAVACGLRGSLHMAVSDDAIDPRLSVFLAHCREEEPEIDIHLSEVTLTEQLQGLRYGDFLLGFAHTGDVGEDIIAEPIWQDRLVVAVSIRHPLLVHKTIPLRALADQPLILYSSQRRDGVSHAPSGILCHWEHEPHIIEQVASQDMMLTLVGAGYGVGFISSNRFALCRCPHVVSRPLAEECAAITTYLLRLDEENPSALLDRFVTRLRDGANMRRD